MMLEKITLCRYRLVTKNKEIDLNFPQLLQLRQKVNELTTPEKLYDIIESENFVLLFVADKQHLLYLDIPQLLDLKEEILCFFSCPKLVLI
ncbi:hypothetical protein EYW44_15495 [Tenacibaculum sp. M341]|nr:hypothetical protein EYW44_15495 [Tenacibaculum sp. M341]